MGKSEMALRIAESLRGEIISADSMQVYAGMDIGTAKPSRADRQRVPHHLLDVVTPGDSFNAADYTETAEKAIAGILERENLPCVVGGTGLYVHALVDGFLFPQEGRDSDIRQELETRFAEEPEAVFAELKTVDPAAAERIHPNDARRIVRALEVYRVMGEPISRLQKKKALEESTYCPFFVGLNRERTELYERINRRVDTMFSAGLVDEVRRLRTLYPKQPTALQALGYKEVWDALEGRWSWEEAVDAVKKRTRRYAKRQLSWFRRDGRIRWFDLSQQDYATVTSTVIEAIQAARGGSTSA